uniref:Uncharacterized protein n=1 Tax=Fagus sylvatica TaxID=28930 RepID=A0A2N9EVY6_FAGSY
MVAQEQYLDPLEENSTTELEDPYEAEETLSLCDLPIYSDASNWDDYSKEDQSLSSSDNNDEFFEFFSEELTASTCSTTTIQNKNIIFCGKLIPYKELPEKSQNQETNNVNTNKTTPRKVGKVTMLASPTKSRWYLYMFGMTRFPTEMELRDIKTRQSRIKSPSMMFRSVECDDMVKGNEDESRRGNGMWRLLRILGCRRQHVNTVVKASFGCIPSARVRWGGGGGSSSCAPICQD